MIKIYSYTQKNNTLALTLNIFLSFSGERIGSIHFEESLGLSCWETEKRSSTSKLQKSLIVPSIERIRKWRSEAKNYSSKIEKIQKLQEKEKFTAAVSSNSTLVLGGGAILENIDTGFGIPEPQDCQNSERNLTSVKS